LQLKTPVGKSDVNVGGLLLGGGFTGYSASTGVEHSHERFLSDSLFPRIPLLKNGLTRMVKISLKILLNLYILRCFWCT